jgi:hypothetical protein
MKTNAIPHILSFLLLVLVGCGKNIVEPLTVEMPVKAPKAEFTVLSGLPGSVARKITYDLSKVEFVDLSKKESTMFNDRHVIRFTTNEPLTTSPVVDYTVIKNTNGVNEVILTILEKSGSETAEFGVGRAEVVILDDNRFSVTIPLKTPDDYPANFFLGDRPLFGIGKPVESTEEEQMPESEDEK